MNLDEILQAAKEADLSKYLRSYSEFDEIAEQAGCDMSAMDGREYETMWCDRAQFEKLCIGISAIIEKRTIERCASLAEQGPEQCEWTDEADYDTGLWHGYLSAAAAIRKLGEQ